MAGYQVRALVDGVEADRLRVTDRGLHYGDGLFETIAVHDGAPCLWREHFDRLHRGAYRLGITCPREDVLRRECGRLIGEERVCVLKILLTRGSGGRGYVAPAHLRPTRVLIRYPFPNHPPSWRRRGVAVTLCRTTLGETPFLAGLKHLNRLEQVLARNEWSDPEVAEGLMFDGRGRVIGGTMSNLFLLTGARLLTPRLDTNGIAGTVRGLVLRICGAFGFEAEERDISRADLGSSDGLFLTNALIGVWPVRRVETEERGIECLPQDLIRAVREAAFTAETERPG